MATLGVSDTLTAKSYQTALSVWGTPIPAANVTEGGTITAVKAWYRRFGSSDQFDLAIAQGGTDTDADTADILWESISLDLETYGVGAGGGWVEITGLSVNFSAGSALWLISHNQGSANPGTTPDGEDGDCGGSIYNTNHTHTQGTSFGATISGTSSHVTSDPFKFIITYTASAVEGKSSVTNPMQNNQIRHLLVR